MRFTENHNADISKSIATLLAKVCPEIIAKMTGSRPDQFILSRAKRIFIQ